MENILISGGSGLVGSYLSVKLIERGYKVSLFSRNANTNSHLKMYNWNISKNEIDKEAIESADYIINLTGANLGVNRWFAQRKKEIFNSKIN